MTIIVARLFVKHGGSFSRKRGAIGAACGLIPLRSTPTAGVNSRQDSTPATCLMERYKKLPLQSDTVRQAHPRHGGVAGFARRNHAFGEARFHRDASYPVPLRSICGVVPNGRPEGAQRLLTKSAAPKITGRSRLCRAVTRTIFVPFRQAALRPGRRKCREARVCHLSD